MANKPKIAVIGAGVVGMTTALMLQERLKGSQIHIIADSFMSDTVSWVAAGLFRPSDHFVAASEKLTRAFMQDSWDHWYNLYNSSDAPKAGVALISGYVFSEDRPEAVQNSYLEEILPEYRSVTEDELKLCPGAFKYGSFSTTLLVQNSIYLPWAQERFLKNGGKIIKKSIDSFDDVSEYDVVMNCTGLGSIYLCNDHKLKPMRGQVIKVKAPWLKTYFYNNSDTYIIPGFDSVTLGGTRQYDSYNKEVCKYDRASILEKCIKLVPGLKNAPVIRDAVGLRPYRPEVRVEHEYVKTGKGKVVKVVHNYGHGGNGVAMAPGTSKHAVNLAIELLSHLSPSKL